MDLADLRERLTSRDWERTEPDPHEPVRFAMLGLGWWTVDRAMPAVAAEPGVETTVLVSSDREKAERIAAEAGLDATILDYGAYHDGDAAEEYDAVYVGTPNATHLEYAETAAELGRAVLCEKPLEASVERAEQLVDAVADVPAMTAYRLQTEPSVRVARHLVREGFVGEPVAIQAHLTGDILEIGGADQWRLDPSMAGRGATLPDIGVYPINTARFLVDDDPVAAVASGYSEHEAFADVPDERASFVLEFPGGLTAACSVSLHAQSSSALRLVGTEGELSLEPGLNAEPRRELHLASGDVRERVAFPTVDQMQPEVAYFADCLRDGREPEPDAAHGLVDVRTIDAIYDAAERGERVGIESGR